MHAKINKLDGVVEYDSVDIVDSDRVDSKLGNKYL